MLSWWLDNGPSTLAGLRADHLVVVVRHMRLVRGARLRGAGAADEWRAAVMRRPFAIGDRVRYHRNFLRAIRVHTGRLPFAQGMIEALQPWHGKHQLATVRWDDGQRYNVHTGNLSRPGYRESERDEVYVPI